MEKPSRLPEPAHLTEVSQDQLRDCRPLRARELSVGEADTAGRAPSQSGGVRIYHP